MTASTGCVSADFKISLEHNLGCWPEESFLSGSHAILLILFADPVDLGLLLNWLLIFFGLIFVFLLMILSVILIGAVFFHTGFSFITTVILSNHLAHFVKISSALTVFPFYSHSVWTNAASSAIVVPASKNIDAGLATGGGATLFNNCPVNLSSLDC